MISLNSLRKHIRKDLGGTMDRPSAVFELVKPMREWAVCLGVAVLAAISLCVYIGFDFYTQFNLVEVTLDDAHHERSPYVAEMGEEIISEYTRRASVFEEILSETDAGIRITDAAIAPEISPLVPGTAEDAITPSGDAPSSGTTTEDFVETSLFLD